MKSSTTVGERTGAMWLGITLMLAAFTSQAVGIGGTTGMAALQASAWIVGIGTPVFWILVRKWHGPISEFNAEQKIAIKRVALGNLGVNLGWPFAGLMIGLGGASAVMALGPVSVGLLEDIKERRVKPILLRLGVLVGIVFATEGWQLVSDPSWRTVLGLFAAACGAWHFWNVPKCLKVLGTGAKKDQGMLVSNLYAAPIIILVAVVASAIFGPGWFPGELSALSVLKVIGLGAFAAVFVFVNGIILINRAEKHLAASTQGVMFAFSPIVSALVGWAGGQLGLIQGNQSISLVNGFGILMVSGFAYWVARVQQANDAADKAAQQLQGEPEWEPVEPLSEEERLRNELDSLQAANELLSRQNQGLQDEVGPLRERVTRAEAQRDRADGEAQRLREELLRIRFRCHAAELAAKHRLPVAGVTAMLNSDLSDEQVAQVARKQIPPFLILWLQGLGCDPAEAIELGGRLPKRSREWYTRLVAYPRPSLRGISRDEDQALSVLLNLIVRKARPGLTEALAEVRKAARLEDVKSS